jgi:hypothetical protein
MIRYNSESNKIVTGVVAMGAVPVADALTVMSILRVVASTIDTQLVPQVSDR